MRVELVNCIPFIERMISIIAKRTKPAAKEQPMVIKNDFKILLSLDLKPITIAKSIIEINIKQSTITSVIISVSDRPSEIFSVTSDEIKSLAVFMKLGPAYIIKSEITKLAKAQSISIKNVKYFEFIS